MKQKTALQELIDFLEPELKMYNFLQLPAYEKAKSLLEKEKNKIIDFGLKVKWNKAVAKNIQMKSKLELFSNYRENPENIDVNGELIFTFKVNSWFSSSMMWNVIYDDDINYLNYDDLIELYYVCKDRVKLCDVNIVQVETD